MTQISGLAYNGYCLANGGIDAAIHQAKLLRETNRTSGHAALQGNFTAPGMNQHLWHRLWTLVESGRVGGHEVEQRLKVLAVIASAERTLSGADAGDLRVMAVTGEVGLADIGDLIAVTVSAYPWYGRPS